MRNAYLLTLFGAAMACSSSPPKSVSDAAVAPAEEDASSPTTEDAGAVDAYPQTDAAACTGACNTLALDAMFDDAGAPFDRAQFGVDGVTRRVEAHFGGDPACPSATSVTPPRPLVLTGIGGSAPKASYFDFQGSGAPLVSATKVTITNVVIEEMRVAFDIDSTFPNGSVKGHVAAVHCTSLD